MDTGTLMASFGLPVGASPARLLRSLRGAGYVPGPLAPSRSEQLFLDTQDGRLFKGGCRLALARAGQVLTWHLSSPEGILQTAFTGDPGFRALSPETDGLPVHVRELAGNRLLLPLVRLKTLAWDVALHTPGGSSVALQLQRFTAAPPRAEWPKGRWPLGFLALRLVEGPPEEALHLATYLRDRLGFVPVSGDACRMGLDALGLPEPGAPPPDALRLSAQDPLAVAARKVVGQQAWKLAANLHGALEDADPEYVHDLRVATRRLRSALRLFADVLGPRRSESLRAETRWVGELLGRVRDLDVFLLNLTEHAARVGDAASVAALLVEELQRQRRAAREALEAALASRRFQALRHHLEALAASPPPRRPRGAQGLPVAWAAPAMIWKAQARVLRLGRSIGPESPAADLHRLRILFKRLRYACE
ncbi:MAG TPA: CHAD domain-containing protein, partial [Candidatus Sulfotelmatobacter sp.]|nr:CHAD domain-containing protein [Candidatus Sulfotelmatobacter sp.]